MKVEVFIVLTHVLCGINTITVPPVWPSQAPKYRQPIRYYKTYNRPNRQNVYKTQHTTVTPVYNNQYKNQFTTTDAYWVPVTPNPIQKFAVHTPYGYISQTFPALSPPSLPRKVFRKPNQKPIQNKYYKPNPNIYQTIDYNRLNYLPHTDKNVPFSPIRGSYLHKVPPYHSEPNNHYLHSDDEKLPDDIEIKTNYETPVSEHEMIKEIPTKPIYPGEGQWARPGIKHQPYIDNTKYSEPIKDDTISDGYDIFERGEDRFKKARENFKFKVDNHASSYKNHEPENEESQDIFEDVHKNKEEDFVPQKLYAQVRRTETKKHVPRSEIDSEEDENAARLKEIIKDSKIQTVYSEEGYEDTAYDHAGHHKKSESEHDHSHKGEGYEKGGSKNFGDKKSHHDEERGRNRARSKYRRTKNKDELSESSDFDNSETYDEIKKNVEQEGNKKIIDSDTAGASDYAIKVPLNRKVGPQRNLQTSKDMKKIEIKSTMKNGDDINMEIHTEVKFLNGSDKKKQKFVRIIPSYKQSIETNNDQNESIEYDNDDTEDTGDLHRRVKRYNPQKLSKIYLRKRPNYYWKKSKTTTFKPEGFTKKVKAEYTSSPNGKFSSTITTKTTTSTHSSVVVPVLKIRKRYKRYAIDDINVEVPRYKFENVDDLPDSTIKPDLTHMKYPYLNIKSDLIHEHSPLRYAQNMKSIPRKTANKMSFYDSKSNIECPEVEDSVNPIPDRIKNKKEDDNNEEEVEQADVGPRLSGLGDKIDCMKLKYFGENPLDSPIFSETEIRIEIPKIFKNVNQKHKKQSSNRVEITKQKINQSDGTIGKLLRKSNHKFTNVNGDSVETQKKELTQDSIKKIRKREINNFDPIVVLDSHEDVNPVVTNNPINIPAGAVLKLPYTFKQMVKKISDDKKKKAKVVLNKSNTSKPILALEDLAENSSSPKFLIIYRNNSVESTEDYNNIQEKINTLTLTTVGYTDPKVSDVIPELGNLSNRMPETEIFNLVPENFTEHDFLAPYNNKNNIGENSTTETNIPFPIFAALIAPNDTIQDDEGRPKYLPVIVPLTNENSLDSYGSGLPTRRLSSFIFDISKYLPQIKNHKIISSEVHYKDEIKPSEQMNVYEDVLKSINISTQEVYENVPSDISQPITVKLQVTNGTRIRYPKRRIRIKTTPNPSKHFRPIKRPIRLVDSKISTTNHLDVHKNTIPDAERITPQLFPTEEPATRKPLPEKIKNMISQYGNPLLINVPDIDYNHETVDLLPPPSNKNHYRTIKPISKIIIQQGNIRLSRHVNNYYVPGLRPPPENQEPMIYSDFIESRRKKRDVSDDYESVDDLLPEDSSIYERYQQIPRKMYTEIVRPRPAKKTETEDVEEEEEEEEEEEDLRPRKRIYDIKPIRRTTTTEKEPEEEYIEVAEENSAIEKPKYQSQFNEKPTGVPEYIKLIDKLHEYWIANNITTTLPEQETTTANPRTTTARTTPKTQTMAESINVRRGEPSYLQIIDNLHQIRKEIEEKNPTTTTTNVPEEEGYPVKAMQNSNPYLPEPEALTSPRTNKDRTHEDSDDIPSFVRNLSSKFRTNIDTSKYKTIERIPVITRHNLSSRYNADDEILPLEKMFTTKMPVIYTTTTKNIVPGESGDREENREEDVSNEDGNVSARAKPRIKVEVIVTQSENSEEDEVEPALITTTSTTITPRRRQRPRTRPTTTSTTRHIETTTNSIVRRRRPTRTRTTTTTELPESSEQTARTSIPANRRRYRQKLDSQTSIKSYVSEIPPNHKREYVPVTEPKQIQPEINDEIQTHPSEKKKRRLEKTHERRLTSEYMSTKYYDPAIHEKPINDDDDDDDDDKKSEYEIIAEIRNPEMKHGGNYRHVNDALIRENNEQDQDNDGQSADLLLMERKPASNINKDYSSQIQSTVSDSIITEMPESENGWRPIFPNYNPSSNLEQKITAILSGLKTETNDNIKTQRKNVQRDDSKVEQGVINRPKIIKDPSKRMYFYAKL